MPSASASMGGDLGHGAGLSGPQLGHLWGLGLHATLGKSLCSLAPSVLLCSGAVALALPIARGSGRAAVSQDSGWMQRFMLTDLLPFPSACCSPGTFLSRSSGPWVPGLKAKLGHGHLSLMCPMFLTLLQDEKGAFNFDQETVINPETGEQVRAAQQSPRVLGGWALTEWQPPLSLLPGPPLPDSELVPEWGDLGQQVQHHCLQL